MKVLNPNKLPTAPIADLLASQGELKDLTEKNYNKLKNTILRRGFSMPVYVWEDKDGLKHLLDGHQRQRVLTTEGWSEPIPYLLVPAENYQEAMARLLEITSQYATITQEGIDTFIAEKELNEAEVYEATSFDALTNYALDSDLGEDFSLADDDKSPFQQMTFTLADEQAEKIKNAIAKAKNLNYETYDNDNSNGNALYWIIKEWVEQKS